MVMSIQVFSNDNPNDIRSPGYQLTYEAWKETWSEEYTQLGKGSDLPSDDFTRQDQILSVMIDGRCAALNFFRAADITTPMARQDSWFKGWPADLLEQLATTHPILLVGSAFTVAKAFRGQKIFDIAIKDMLAAALTYHLMEHMNYGSMVGSMRNTRGTNTVVYKLGVTYLRTVQINSEPTDLVLFEIDKLPPLPEEIQFLLRRAWVHPPKKAGRKKKAA